MSKKKTQKVKVIDKDCIIKAEIPGIFYYRFNKMLGENFEYKDKEHFKQIMEDIKEGSLASLIHTAKSKNYVERKCGNFS